MSGDILLLEMYFIEWVISYRKWCPLQAEIQTILWRSRSPRSLLAGSPHRRAAEWRWGWEYRWHWGLVRSWWRLIWGPLHFHCLPHLHLHLHRCRCRTWSHCPSWLCWESSDFLAGCASLSPPSDSVLGCCCGGMMPAMEAHLLQLSLKIRKEDMVR